MTHGLKKTPLSLLLATFQNKEPACSIDMDVVYRYGITIVNRKTLATFCSNSFLLTMVKQSTRKTVREETSILLLKKKLQLPKTF